MKNFKAYIIETAQLTLQYHDELNPDLWQDFKLKPEIKDKLIQIAKAWAEFAKIPSSTIHDLIVVGGNANYNYTNFSDIDLHLLIDKSELAESPKLVDEYLKDKKELWGLSHSIKIYGHDVELYAQDINEAFPKGQGVYSLTKDDWLVAPTKQNVDLHNPHIQKKVDEYISRIDSLINSNAEFEAFGKLKKKFSNMRSAGIKRAGEFSEENLIFKELRNLGYLDKLSRYLKTKQDQNLSI
jgi:hypothetical protein